MSGFIHYDSFARWGAGIVSLWRWGIARSTADPRLPGCTRLEGLQAALVHFGLGSSARSAWGDGTESAMNRVTSAFLRADVHF